LYQKIPGENFDRRRRGNYNVDMRAKLVPIGNSRGIRLPKAVIDQYALADEVDLEMKKDHIVVRASRRPREGWEEAFARMAAKCDDALLDEGSVHAETEWERTGWRW
jgi:antitoxin MazE